MKFLSNNLHRDIFKYFFKLICKRSTVSERGYTASYKSSRNCHAINWFVVVNLVMFDDKDYFTLITLIL